MKGHIRQRGKQSWELKFDVGRHPVTGRRKIQYHTFRGSKRAAQVKLAELIAAVGAGTYVESSKVTVAQLLRSRVAQWEGAEEISARTAQRYRQLIDNQVIPYLGNKAVQKLKPLDIEAWHADLRVGGRKRGNGGVSARTIGHAHRVLSKALKEAVRNEVTTRNVAEITGPPKVEAEEMMILGNHKIGTLINKLRGKPLYVPGIIALFTGLRLGEVFALRWSSINLGNTGVPTICVREALEETATHGIRFKTPKTRAGRRDTTLPDFVVEVLREHRRKQLELRMQLGLGQMPHDELLFSDASGSPRAPSTVSREWGLVASQIGMPWVTFHTLRHTHASQLIDAGVDVVTISRRLGHANPSVTLQVYAHLFHNDDSKAAYAINAALLNLGHT